VSISGSFATGKVTVIYEANFAYAGGLAAANERPTQIVNSYSTGATDAQGEAPYVGGFIGINDLASATTSYSIGKVTKGQFGLAGGFIGDEAGSCSDCYWDTDKSGQSNGTGAGSDSGITALTTKQFRSAVPQGFDPTIWAQKKGINHGFPYLIANPPPG
jgi:hypothetical protein